MNFRLSLASVLLLPAAFAATSAPSGEEARSGGFVFSLLPKSLQREPRVDLNVITEMTAEGRKLTPPTPQQPVYYSASPVGFLQRGQDAPANEKPPPVADLARVMQKALATNGYLPATPAHPPALLLLYYWGSHSHQTEDAQEVADQMNAAYSDNPPPAAMSGDRSALEQLPQVLSDLAKRKELIERAALVGGSRFAAELAQALNEEVQFAEGTAPPPADPSGSVPAPRNIMGDMQGLFTNAGSPFYRFMNRDDKTRQLVEEAFSSFYFVIASAFDYPAVSKGERRLLWRTKMTVNSLGVAMQETLPPLIVSAGRYFGRDMKETAILSRKIFREGKVDVGAPILVDFVDPAAPPAEPLRKDPPKK